MPASTEMPRTIRRSPEKARRGAGQTFGGVDYYGHTAIARKQK